MMRIINNASRRWTSVLVISGFLLTLGPVTGQDERPHVPSPVTDGPPGWLKTYPFAKSFAFVRLRYDQPVGRWATDYPDADLNFSTRLSQLTSLTVAPNGVVLNADDPKLLDHSFAYLSANGPWTLTDPQTTALRDYLEGGGFLMIDDSWGAEEEDHIHSQLRRVLPNRTPEELPLRHEIFHCVFDLNEKPQVCGIFSAHRGRAKGITWEGPDAKHVSYQGITDDNGRLMVLICHNTDLADGWERCKDDEWYAAEFSEKRAFPMGINAVFYALTTNVQGATLDGK